jgi:hypothetical protein
VSCCSGGFKLETCEEGDEGMLPGEGELGDGTSTEKFGPQGGGGLGLQLGDTLPGFVFPADKG